MTTLVLMACSATKRLDGRKPMPAHELYNGPMWQTLRTHKPRSIPWSHVLVLSAIYGVISSEERIGPYEAKLTPFKANYTITRGVDAANDQFGVLQHAPHGPSLAELAMAAKPIDRVIVAAAAEYRRVFVSLVDQLLTKDCMGPRASVLQVNGGIGVQREQLGRWIRETET
jgi:hypothetical protein